MEPVDRAIAKHQQLLTDRDSPEYWADNIIEASEMLRTEHDWTIFYAYLSDKDNYDKKKKYVTMADVVCDPIPPCHPNMEEVIYQNGNAETIIHIKRKEDDEKVSV